jgi:hypothetical protein
MWCASETIMLKETWTEPQPGWVPLNSAVFKFGISEEASFSSEDLTNILKEKCGASSAAIDPSTATLSILFSDGLRRSFIGEPWKLLETLPEEHVEIKSKHTHVYTLYYDAEGNEVSGELYKDYAENDKRSKKVRAAIDLIWRQSMLPAFDSAIATGRVALYARPHIASPYFERLPAHVWSLLKVVDWDRGIAMAVDSTAFWSIHVELAAASNQLVPLAVDFHLQNQEVATTEAPHAVIHRAIKEVYDRAQAAGSKPPNIKELPAAVSRLLKQQGHRATDSLIMRVGEDPQFKNRRLPQGRRLPSSSGE